MVGGKAFIKQRQPKWCVVKGAGKSIPKDPTYARALHVICLRHK